MTSDRPDRVEVIIKERISFAYLNEYKLMIKIYASLYKALRLYICLFLSHFYKQYYSESQKI